MQGKDAEKSPEETLYSGLYGKRGAENVERNLAVGASPRLPAGDCRKWNRMGRRRVAYIDGMRRGDSVLCFSGHVVGVARAAILK